MQPDCSYPWFLQGKWPVHSHAPFQESCALAQTSNLMDLPGPQHWGVDPISSVLEAIE